MRIEGERRHDAALGITRRGGQELVPRLQRAIGPGFRIVRELGGGGMSRLFLARQLAPHRLVVAKVLADRGPDEVEHLRQEAVLTASLRHPHVLPVLTAGESEGIAFFVTPYVTGGTLRDRLLGGAPLSSAEARHILRDIAAALAHVHAHGIVHGDVKPENVLLQHGRALLADFGAARPARRSPPGADLTARPTAGTPLYMSPEQAAGDPFVGPRSDVYSFGVLAFELLTGRTPFVGLTPRAVLLAHLGEPVPCLVRLRPDLPPALVAVVARALAKDPADRHADGAALLAALDRSSPATLPVSAHPREVAAAGWTGGIARPLGTLAWRQRAASIAGTVVAAAGGLGLSALALAGAAMMMMRAAPQPPTEPAVASARHTAAIVDVVSTHAPPIAALPTIVTDDELRPLHADASCDNPHPRRLRPAVVIRVPRSA